MIAWRDGVVSAVTARRPGAAECRVRLPDGTEVPALAYVDLVGDPRPGDRALLNASALDLGLGTGGYALVVALPERLPPDRGGGRARGHLVKARYSPTQVVVQGADEQGSPHHEALRDADSVGGMPVVVADLHSALPAVLAALLADAPHARVAYVMTDGGALPLAFSRTVAGLRAAGALVGTVTVGQAYGGDLEAVTLHTGLLAARLVLHAEVAVVSQGPGNLGTGTRWGFSGVAVGEAVNAVAALGGRPVAALRVSGADLRDRHRGVSHHTTTALTRVALAPAEVPVPLLPGDVGDAVRADVAALAPPHALVPVDVTGLDEVLEEAARRWQVPLSTMGRGMAADPAAFLASAAAGRHAAARLG